MLIQFIRHGMTEGNETKKYIGSTDEPLSKKGIDALRQCPQMSCDVLYVSPMLRCRQTAGHLFPNQKMIEVSNLRECDFGTFEGKNYQELNGNEEYQKWIDSNGTLPFPKGESVGAFKERCCSEFLRIVEEIQQNPENMTDKKEEFSAAFVVHGGTIMAIMERFAYPKKGYYDYMCENLGGYLCHWEADKRRLTILQENLH